MPSVPILILALLGDVVILKNGGEIRGELLQETEETLVLGFPGGTLQLRRRDVERIEREPRQRYLVEEAERQLTGGNYQDSIATFREALAADPDSERARKGLFQAKLARAEELFRLGRYLEAAALSSELLEEDPDSPAAKRLSEKIEKTLEEGRTEEERALDAIGRGELEAGVSKLERVYERFPDRRDAVRRQLASALVSLGHRDFERGEWAQAERKYLRALELDPEAVSSVEERYVYLKQREILPLVGQGDFQAAEIKVREGLDVRPASEVLRYYLGLCLEAKGESRRAAEEYLAILGAKRPADLETAALALRHEVEAKLAALGSIPPVPSPHSTEILPGEFQELETQRFRIRHKSPTMAREVALAAERCYSRIFEHLGCAAHPRSKIEIVIFPSREEFAQSLGEARDAGGYHTLRRKLGSLSEHRIYTYQGQARLTSGVLPHEIAHALLLHRLGYPDRIPLWANEGFAVHAEAEYFHRHCRELLYREVVRRSALPIREIVEREQYPVERPELFYAQCFSLVEFLLELEGLPKFLEYLKEISRPGANQEAELKRRFGIATFAALENRWIAWFERSLAARTNGKSSRTGPARSE